MIGHAVYRDQFIAVVPDDPGDVFVNLFLVFAANQGQTTADREDGLNVNLCVSICHEIYISLLTELTGLMATTATNISPLRGWLPLLRRC